MILFKVTHVKMCVMNFELLMKTEIIIFVHVKLTLLRTETHQITDRLEL